MESSVSEQQQMNRPSYPSDLSDDEWEILQPLIPIRPLAKIFSAIVECYFLSNFA